MISAGAAEPAPLPAAVRTLVEHQARSWDTGDKGGFTGTVHADAGFAYPGKRLAVAGALKTFRDWQWDFRDTKMHVRRVVIDGVQFAVEYMFATTNVASGKRTEACTVAISEVRDGKTIVWKEDLDGRGSRQQAAGELPGGRNGGAVSLAGDTGKRPAVSEPRDYFPA